MSDQARERRVRREAEHQGRRLKKLRNDDGYWLIDCDTGGLVVCEEICGGVRVGYTLDAIEQFLES